MEALVTADRPESIITWMRHLGVIDVLTQLGNGTLAPTHKALDALRPGRHIEHIRAILVDTGQLPPRDDALARFERWLDDKLAPITDATMRRPIELFARWHHLRSIRKRSSAGTTSQDATHNAKQEITAAITFLTWLKDDANHTLATCTQRSGTVSTTQLSRSRRELRPCSFRSSRNRSHASAHSRPPPSKGSRTA
ncbi:hypothetical protein N1028_15870 [Herbiconiux sp. CPCC 203407]|uniref:Uncharacterized protein n=1 Tax=Herbiconiux oxytropis TaxID=2970915 RepID=A0AA42BWW5_9MICO|nr:hypothetical protein [Herbiconiux oxytropis]MCS5721847.1 hypothetical protein [Herbiconiux oxytropis]MCS5727373.1 hypothetical protein [Herbiconiux oxytropis]